MQAVSLGAPELLIILVIVLLLFGGAKLPALARSLGKAQREFREGVSDTETTDKEQTDKEQTDKEQPGQEQQEQSADSSGTTST